MASAVEATSTTKGAKDTLDKQRSKFKNTSEMVCYSLANRTHRRAVMGMQMLAEPSQIGHGQSVIAFETQCGVRRWHSRMANMEYHDDVLLPILRAMSTDEAMSKLFRRAAPHSQ